MKILYKKIFKNKEIHISYFQKGFIFGFLIYKNKNFDIDFTHKEIFIGVIQIDIYDFK